MSITTYDELKSAVASYLARDDLTTNIPDFITLAEARLNRSLHHPGMETRATATVATTSDEPEFLDLPTDFQSMRRLYMPDVTGTPSLEFKSEAQLARYRSSIGNATGQPRCFTVFGTELEMAPTPDSAYTLEMVYRGKLTALSTSNTSNWLLELSPDVYLFGALVQAAAFTRDNDGATVWAAAYHASLDELTEHGRKLKYGPTPLAITRGSEVAP